MKQQIEQILRDYAGGGLPLEEAVEMIENLKAEIKKECETCLHEMKQLTQMPCSSCYNGKEYSLWELKQ